MLLLSSDVFFQNYNRNFIKVPNGLDPDQDQITEQATKKETAAKVKYVTWP